MIMDKRTRARVARAAKSVQDGDLYDCLHRVGDDPVKAEIETALKELLDDRAYREVVAVFKVATGP